MEIEGGHIDPALLNDVLPVGVVVTDATGTIRHTNRRASEMTGYSVEDAVGRSILEFVSPDDVTFLLTAITEGGRYPDSVMGPVRVRYRDRHGRETWTEYWAYACPPEFGFEGYVVTMSTESVADHLARAVHDVAAEEPLDACLGATARAVSASPLNALGTILLRAGDDVRVVGGWPAEDIPVDGAAMPWQRVLREGVPIEAAATDLPPEQRSPLVARGIGSVWIRPIVDDSGAVAAAFIAWRHDAEEPSLNQARHLDDVVSVARLALVRHEQRQRLELAATVDPLTGLGNRSKLRQRLAAVDDVVEAVLYVDLDGFKVVNDTYGHDVGDHVLAATGQRLAAVVREEDQVFRIGGDEFVVVCAGVPAGSASEAAGAIAQRVVETLGRPFEVGLSETIRIGASVGVAERLAGESGEVLVTRSDRALLEAKRAGKSRWHRAE